MFDFLKKNKKIDTNEVKAFDSAVKAIEVFIAISEWWNAKKAIEEILYKETDALNKFLENYESEDISLENKKYIDNYLYILATQKFLSNKKAPSGEEASLLLPNPSLTTIDCIN